MLSRRLLPQLLSLLQPRTTSWATGSTIITGLMARLDGFDAGWSQAQITREILTTSPVIHPLMLLHDKVTMNSSGPWSWCPPSLLDTPLHHFTTFSKELVVQDGGKLWGVWTCQSLTEDVVKPLRPYSSHRSVAPRVREALRTWQDCLLLSPADRRTPTDLTAMPYLLVVKGAIY